MKEIIVEQKYNGKKLNNFLLNTFDGLSLNVLYKALRKKDIRVNDVRINENVVLHTGDHVKVYISDEQLTASAKNVERKFAVNIVYEDEHICVVNKPVGIEVTGENSLTSVLKEHYLSKFAKSIAEDTKVQSSSTWHLYFSKLAFVESEKHNCQQDGANSCKNLSQIFINPCHRLDRNTTGLVLFAKDEVSLEILLDKFKHHEIEKHYLAKVYGIPTKKQDILTAYLFKDAKKSLVYISDVPKKGYEKIITSYKVVEEKQKENTSILDVNLHTGKTHQIRAHLAHIGYPILGDGKYGNNEINKKFGYKTQQLCSYSITFRFKADSGILNYLNNREIKLM